MASQANRAGSPPGHSLAFGLPHPWMPYGSTVYSDENLLEQNLHLSAGHISAFSTPDQTWQYMCILTYLGKSLAIQSLPSPHMRYEVQRIRWV